MRRSLIIACVLIAVLATVQASATTVESYHAFSLVAQDDSGTLYLLLTVQNGHATLNYSSPPPGYTAPFHFALQNCEIKLGTQVTGVDLFTNTPLPGPVGSIDWVSSDADDPDFSAFVEYLRTRPTNANLCVSMGWNDANNMKLDSYPVTTPLIALSTPPYLLPLGTTVTRIGLRYDPTVPEPSSLAALLTALAGTGCLLRRRTRC